MSKKLRDDMMHFRGELTGLGWVSTETSDWVENMRAQFESILKRVVEDFDDE